MFTAVLQLYLSRPAHPRGTHVVLLLLLLLHCLVNVYNFAVNAAASLLCT